MIGTGACDAAPLHEGLTTTALGATSTDFTKTRLLVTSRNRIQRATPPAKLIRQTMASLPLARSMAVVPGTANAALIVPVLKFRAKRTKKPLTHSSVTPLASRAMAPSGAQGSLAAA